MIVLLGPFVIKPTLGAPPEWSRILLDKDTGKLFLESTSQDNFCMNHWPNSPTELADGILSVYAPGVERKQYALAVRENTIYRFYFRLHESQGIPVPGGGVCKKGQWTNPIIRPSTMQVDRSHYWNPAEQEALNAQYSAWEQFVASPNWYGPELQFQSAPTESGSDLTKAQKNEIRIMMQADLGLLKHESQSSLDYCLALKFILLGDLSRENANLLAPNTANNAAIMRSWMWPRGEMVKQQSLREARPEEVVRFVQALLVAEIDFYYPEWGVKPVPIREPSIQEKLGVNNWVSEAVGAKVELFLRVVQELGPPLTQDEALTLLRLTKQLHEHSSEEETPEITQFLLAALSAEELETSIKRLNKFTGDWLCQHLLVATREEFDLLSCCFFRDKFTASNADFAQVMTKAVSLGVLDEVLLRNHDEVIRLFLENKGGDGLRDRFGYEFFQAFNHLGDWKQKLEAFQEACSKIVLEHLLNPSTVLSAYEVGCLLHSVEPQGTRVEILRKIPTTRLQQWIDTPKTMNELARLGENSFELFEVLKEKNCIAPILHTMDDVLQLLDYKGEYYLFPNWGGSGYLDRNIKSVLEALSEDIIRVMTTEDDVIRFVRSINKIMMFVDPKYIPSHYIPSTLVDAFFDKLLNVDHKTRITVTVEQIKRSILPLWPSEDVNTKLIASADSIEAMKAALLYIVVNKGDAYQKPLQDSLSSMRRFLIPANTLSQQSISNEAREAEAPKPADEGMGLKG